MTDQQMEKITCIKDSRAGDQAAYLSNFLKFLPKNERPRCGKSSCRLDGWEMKLANIVTVDLN